MVNDLDILLTEKKKNNSKKIKTDDSQVWGGATGAGFAWGDTPETIPFLMCFGYVIVLR